MKGNCFTVIGIITIPGVLRDEPLIIVGGGGGAKVGKIVMSELPLKKKSKGQWPGKEKMKKIASVM